MKFLGEVSPAELASTRHWTVHRLWACLPNETAEKIQDLMLSRQDVAGEYAAIFDGIRSAMPPAMLGLLIDFLRPQMENEGLDTLHHRFYQLARGNRLMLIDRLKQLAGTIWEERLTQLLVDKNPLPQGWHDGIQKDAVHVLYRIGGQGFTRLVNHWLKNGEVYARREAIDRAFKRPDDETLHLLEALANEGTEREDEGGERHPTYDAYLAQLALARAESWLSVVKSLVLWSKDSNREVIYARWDAAPLSDADMEPALTALQEAPKHAGAIMALGFGQRTDYAHQIIKLLSEEDAQDDSGVVNACLWALTVLPSIPPEAVTPLSRCLSRLHSRWLVVPLLIRAGNMHAAQVLMGFLKEELSSPHSGPRDMSSDGMVSQAASFLIHHPITRSEAEKLCRLRISQGAEPDALARHLIDTLLEEGNTQKEGNTQEEGDNQEAGGEYSLANLLDESTSDFLMKNAFREDTGIYFAGEKARLIRGLSVLNAEDAYTAALQVLQSPKANDRESAPQLLLEINRKRATGDLLNHLTTEKQSFLRQICGRALCEAGVIDELREQYLVSSDPAFRAAACFALGFAPAAAQSEIALRSCLEDEDVHVFEEACRALNRMNTARCTDELVTAYLSEPNKERRWILLDTALETGDVFDVSWLRRMLHNAPHFIVSYVQEQVKKQRGKVKDKAKSEDWHNHID